jgi:hypothetical protein
MSVKLSCSFNILKFLQKEACGKNRVCPSLTLQFLLPKDRYWTGSMIKRQAQGT